MVYTNAYHVWVCMYEHECIGVYVMSMGVYVVCMCEYALYLVYMGVYVVCMCECAVHM